MSEQENFERIFGILQRLVASVEDLSQQVTSLEAKDAITKPLWQEMRADQQRILERMDQTEAHLLRQDEKIAALNEKVEIGFHKLGDKLDHLVLDYYELRTDVRDLNRRVTRLEPVR